MKKILSVLIAFTLSFSALAQSNEEICREAVSLFESGDFVKSNQKFFLLYEQKYMLDLVSYYISANYYAQKEYAKAIKFASKSIKLSDSYAVKAAFVKGKSLNQIQKLFEEEDFYRQMIKKFPDEFSLHNFLVTNLLQRKLYDKAEDELKKSISLDKFGWFAHLKLGDLNADNQLFIHAIMCYYYFIFTDNKTSRTQEIVKKIAEIMNFNEFDRIISMKTAREETLTKEQRDLIWAMMFFSDMKKIKFSDDGLPQMDTFIENSKKLLIDIVDGVGETPNGFYEDFYLSFFRNIIKNNFLDTFLYYALVNVYPQINSVITSVSKDKMSKFADFLSIEWK